jgi:Delta3-Delta2-enoyl-CoA isomerase
MQFLDLEIKDGVAVITMRCQEKNALTAGFVQELRECFVALEKDAAVKSAVITGGHEKYFCTGLDLDWMVKQQYEDVVKFLVGVTQLLKDTALFYKPLIGAINGHAFGLGAIWSSGFDFRLMREDKGWVCFPEMDINIPFLPGMIALCEHGLGTVCFRQMAWSAKRYSGPEAKAVGYADELLPKDALLPRAIELARFMGMKAQPAFGLTKQRWASEIGRIIEELDPAAIRKQIPAPK